MATRWRPAWCQCVIVYDDIEPSGEPVAPVIEYDCGAHGAQPDARSHFHAAMAYNQRQAEKRK